MSCAPGHYDSKNQTCFTTEQLREMANGYNKYIKKHQPNAIPIDTKLDKRELLKEFKTRFQNICGDNEKCLTQLDFMKEILKETYENIVNDTFRVEGPQGPKEWLATNHITKVIKQYENLYSDFLFLDAVPQDCNELSFCSLYKIDFDKHHQDGYRRFGVIFNLDKYGQPGSHWVALFMDVDKCEVYYVDSTGKPPKPNTEAVINEFIKFIKKKFNKECVYKFNTVSYQTDNTECGVYSENFIIRMLSGESYEDIIKNALDFEKINSCRNAYFSNKPSGATPHPLCDPKPQKQS
jgi:hypothetical protein